MSKSNNLIDKEVVIKQKFGYKFIGRKLYIALGSNYVVSMEKLMVKPEELGLVNPKNGDEAEKVPFMRIENVFLITKEGKALGTEEEVISRPVRKPIFNGFGYTILDYFTNPDSWITQEEYEKMNKENS